MPPVLIEVLCAISLNACWALGTLLLVDHAKHGVASYSTTFHQTTVGSWVQKRFVLKHRLPGAEQGIFFFLGGRGGCRL